MRVHALGAAAAGEATAQDIVDAMGVSERDALKALGSLRMAGLIDEDGRLITEISRQIGAAIPTASGADPEILVGTWTDEETAILTTFFSGARLTEIPQNQTKRRVVLERLAQEFEPGVRYEERDLSFRLQMFHEDYAALRRYLVDEGFLTRVDGLYWRSGGRSDARPPGS